MDREEDNSTLDNPGNEVAVIEASISLRVHRDAFRQSSQRPVSTRSWSYDDEMDRLVSDMAMAMALVAAYLHPRQKTSLKLYSLSLLHPAASLREL